MQQGSQIGWASAARIAQQQNDYDCGVFVVDGTRALVRDWQQGSQTC
ncbi:Ulp1 family isopeptidase [Bradyrhizobium altum]|nr:Ulp1 family isopeptidase [Bradyrhizobium altum]